MKFQLTAIIAVAVCLAEARFVQHSRSTLVQRQAAGIDLGSCTDPTIIFAAGLEGRKETSFQPNNLQEFNHGSAQNKNIITQFICDEFRNSCGADQAAQDTCAQAEAAISGLPNSGAAADQFNSFFGKTTNFAAVQAFDSQGNAVGGAGNAAVAVNNNGNAAQIQQDQQQQTQQQATNNNGQQANNEQQQQQAVNNVSNVAGGDLGVARPAVQNVRGDRPFVVNGDSFVNEAAAIQRACAIQNNACANAANSGAAFSVADCNAQEQQCRGA